MKGAEMNELKKRWISILRTKAEEYEHVARSNGKIVSSPCLDDLCNEIEAFFAGLNQGAK